MKNSVNNSDLLKPYFKLKHQEYVIEKSVEALMVNTKTNLEYWNSIKQEFEKAEEEREKLEESMKESVRNIYEELKSVREMISRENVKTIDVDAFKIKLNNLWKKILELKASCKPVEDLIAEQSSLEADLNVLTRVIRKHKDLSNVRDSVYNFTNSKKGQTQNKDSEQNDDDDECKEDFTSLVAKTGHSGSWDDADHLLYVKLRKKHKNITSLIQALQSKCPYLTKEAIVNHDAWYRTYLELRDKQRRAVQEWRKRKEAERSKMTGQRPTLIRAESAPEVMANSPRQKEKTCSSMELDQTEKAKVEQPLDVEKKREMVRLWRQQKEKMKMEEEERMKERLKAREEERENKWKARDARLKKILAESKDRNVDEETKLSGEILPSVPSSVILQAYRARDQEFIERRRNVLLSKINVPKQCIPAVQYHFSNIHESTLMNETKAWQEKQRAVEPKVMHTVNYIKDLPKRAMVTWKSYEIPDSTIFRQSY